MFINDPSITLELDFQLVPKIGEFYMQSTMTFTECSAQG